MFNRCSNFNAGSLLARRAECGSRSSLASLLAGAIHQLGDLFCISAIVVDRGLLNAIGSEDHIPGFIAAITAAAAVDLYDVQLSLCFHMCQSD
jgi:hypothetical protein